MEIIYVTQEILQNWLLYLVELKNEDTLEPDSASQLTES